MKNWISIVLAAGSGTRMKSATAKVLHPICGKPMIHYCINNLLSLGIMKNIVVVGHQGQRVIDTLKGIPTLTFVWQKEQLGTANAVSSAEIEFNNFAGDVLILCGDAPALTPNLLASFMDEHLKNKNSLTILTTRLLNPSGYGRMILNSHKKVVKIVEEKDATEKEKKLNEINSGIYCIKAKLLQKYLKKIKNDNKQKEFYLTDLVSLLVKNEGKVGTYLTQDANSILGINSRLDLINIQKLFQKRINDHWLLNGVTILNPTDTYIDSDVTIGQDTSIYPNTVLQGKTVIGSNCIIEQNNKISNTTIGNDVMIKSSCYITESIIDDMCQVGPFAQLRPLSHLKKGVHIGNFVEIKNTTINENSKASHLSYLGDALIGKNVNVGCGVITCNYDGVKKSKTIIEDNCFIGSDSQLVAPVTVKKNAYIASGSTINKDVPEDALAIARSRQENKLGYAIRFRRKK